MSIARDIVEFSRTTSFDPFDDNAAKSLQQLPHGVGLLRGLRDVLGEPQSVPVMLTLLQCLAIERADARRTALAAEFVATSPTGVVPGIRPTAVVAREMIAKARNDVLALGYLIGIETGVIEALHSVAKRGVNIRIVCDREGKSGVDIRAGWPMGIPAPEIYVNSSQPEASALAKMHCKMLLVDSADLLITSANFTYHGLSENIEFGVRIRGQEAILAKRFFDHLCAKNLLTRIHSACST